MTHRMILSFLFWFFWVVDSSGRTILVSQHTQLQDCTAVQYPLKRTAVKYMVSPCLNDTEVYRQVIQDLAQSS